MALPTKKGVVMQQYIDSIKLSLSTKNYFGAIAMALALPDICASVDATNNKTTGKKYCEWFNKYLADTYKQIFQDRDDIVVFGAPECYAARCSFLHQGTEIIEHQESLKYMSNPAVKVNFMSLGMGRYIRNGDFLNLDVHFFCEDMINAVQKWMNDIKHDESKMRKIAAMPIIHESFNSLCGANKSTIT